MKVEPLREAISILLPAVDSKGLVQQFSYLYFNKNHVEATDGALLVRAELAEESPEFAVEASVFASLLKTVNQKDIDITVEGKKVLLKAKGLKTELALPASEERPNIDFNIDKWEDVPEDFLSGLQLCRFTACPDQTSAALTGVRVEGTDIISTDRWRISLYSMGKSMPSMTLPVTLIDQLARFTSDVVGYCIKGSTIYFDVGKAIIGAQLTPGDYPSETLLGAVSQTDEAIRLKITDAFRKGISEAGKRQNIVQQGMLEFDRQSEFSYSAGAVRLYAQNESVGTVEEMLD